MQGWISLHRKFKEWEWYDDSKVVHLFLHCLIKANHKENNWRGITIEAGQFVTSRDKLSAELPLSVQQIRTGLSKLKSTGEITIKTTSKYSIISITNWSEYQNNNQQSDTQTTIKQPTNNQQVTTNNNDNNINNDNNKKQSPKNSFSDDDLNLAKLIYLKIKEVAPKTKVPNYDSWANSIRLMRERDSHTIEEIKTVFLWANSDNFWRTNILSPSKLRDQFAKLHAQMGNRKQDNHSGFEEKDYRSGEIIPEWAQ